jgi:glycerophosphoryl diester phosphodiesterase
MPNLNRLMVDQSTFPIVIAQRGASGCVPEHTVVATGIAHAMGADSLEQGIVATKDHPDQVVQLLRPMASNKCEIEMIFSEETTSNSEQRYDSASHERFRCNKFAINRHSRLEFSASTHDHVESIKHRLKRCRVFVYL